jgi:hypothetical protein
MAVAVTIDSKDGSTYVVTVVGTAAEVGSELASGAVAHAATAGTTWDGSQRSLVPCASGATNVCTVIYLAKKAH